MFPEKPVCRSKSQELEPDIEIGPASNWERKTGYILSSCLFNLYAEYIWWNATLDVAQAGIKIAGRTINNTRYADNTTTMEERKEKLKSLLMWMKEENKKAGLKLNIQKTEIMASGPSLHGIEKGRKWKVTDFTFLGLQNHHLWWLQSWN